MRVFLEETDMWVHGLVRPDLKVGRHHAISWEPEWNTNAEERQIHILSWSYDSLLLLLDIETPGSPAYGFQGLYHSSQGSQATSLRMRVTPSVSLVLWLLDVGLKSCYWPPCLSCLQICRWHSIGLLASMIMWANFPNKSPLVYLSFFLSVSAENPELIHKPFCMPLPTASAALSLHSAMGWFEWMHKRPLKWTSIIDHTMNLLQTKAQESVLASLGQNLALRKLLNLFIPTSHNPINRNNSIPQPCFKD
jgi:hypothetical protein